MSVPWFCMYVRWISTLAMGSIYREQVMSPTYWASNPMELGERDRARFERLDRMAERGEVRQAQVPAPRTPQATLPEHPDTGAFPVCSRIREGARSMGTGAEAPIGGRTPRPGWSRRCCPCWAGHHGTDSDYWRGLPAFQRGQSAFALDQSWWSLV